MKKIIVIIFTSLFFFSCVEENKNNCLESSLVNKLDMFKKELLDSLPPSNRNIAAQQLFRNAIDSNIFLNHIDFSAKEIQSLKKCLCDSLTIFSDSLMINSLLKKGRNEMDTQILKSKSNNRVDEHLYLFWTYHLIDKSFVSNTFIIRSNDLVILDGDTLSGFNEINQKISNTFSQIDSNIFDRAYIAIKADKNIDMSIIDNIEDELRKLNVLKVKYSIL